MIICLFAFLGLVGSAWDIQALPADSTLTPCSTAACNEAAHFISTSLNKSANPCEDFYEFSCGGWEAHHQIPDFKSHTGISEELEDVQIGQIRALIEHFNVSAQFKLAPASVTYSAHLYQQCLALGEEPSHVGVAKVQEVVQAILGEQWNIGHPPKSTTGRSWHENYVRGYAHGGLSPIFSISVEVDAKNVSSKIISIDPSDFGLDDQEMANLTRNVNLVHAYKTFIQHNAQLLCANSTIEGHKCPTAESLEADVDELIQLEHHLAQFLPKNEDDRDPDKSYNKLTLAKLSEKTGFDWLGKILNPIWKGLGVGVAPLTSHTHVLVSDVKYLVRAIHLLNQTSSRILDNYFGWVAVDSFAGVSSESFRDIRFEFRKVASGVKQKSERWRTCMGMTLGWAVSRIWVDHHFSPKEKLQASILIDEIQRSFVALLNENSWLDSETKNVSISKLQHVKKNVAYPAWLLNNTELEEFHGLHNSQFVADLLAEKNIILTSLKFGLHQLKLDFDELHKPLDLDKNWPMSPHVINAAYSPEQNSITIPAGQLISPFFNADYPFAVNYGNIGATVGHEFTHGLDDEGRKFDEHGNLHNWWSEEAAQRFANRSACFVKQYGAQREKTTGMKLDGENTLGENIADNGGLHEAFHAYQSHVTKFGPSPRLAALPEYTSDQLFFISYGNSWCSKVRPESMRNQIEYNPHAPAQYRVNIPVANSDDFARAFKCPVGSTLNSAHKCRLW